MNCINIKVIKSGDNMKKGYSKILIIEIILLFSLLLNSFLFKVANAYEITGGLLLFLTALIAFFGFEKDNFRYKKDVLLNILICLLIYYFVTYFLGLFTGFVRNSYSLSLINIIKNTFPVILLIIISELLRYELFSKSKGNLLCSIIGYIIFILIDVNLMVHVYNVATYLGLTKMICLVVFPSITKNIFLIYITNKVGYKNAILYRLLTDLSTYLLPIFPDFGEYINVVVKTILPIIIMARLNNMFSYYDLRKIKSSKYNTNKMILYSVITFVLFIVVMLTSGLFRYQALTIGSSSMDPNIKKGDVVIVKKLKKSEIKQIKKGQVLVHSHDDKIIVHRVVKILNINGKKNFITKGDNNNTKDSWVIKESEVIGTVSIKIRYIGMPTVALNELLNR